MITINISTNIAETIRQLRARQAQIPRATTVALNRTARDVKAEVDRQLPRIFDRPTPFTMRAIATRPATVASLTATVYIQPIQAKYLALQQVGGVRFPKGKAFGLPTDFPVNEYGNVPRGTIKKLLQRRDVFTGTVHGIPGIWQRQGRGLLLLFAWVPRTTYRPRFDFAGIARAVIERRIRANTRDAIAETR
jgi:hypothetical protein